MIVVLHSPYFCPFPQLNIKLKDRHFDTVEVIGAESQVVLNTLTEHEALGTVHSAEGDNFEGDGGQPKVIF
jgi:hypothetical protein